jgi:hypothetical protein
MFGDIPDTFSGLVEVDGGDLGDAETDAVPAICGFAVSSGPRDKPKDDIVVDRFALSPHAWGVGIGHAESPARAVPASGVRSVGVCGVCSLLASEDRGKQAVRLYALQFGLRR